MMKENLPIVKKISAILFVCFGIISFLIFHSYGFKLSTQTHTTLKNIVSSAIWILLSYIILKIFSKGNFAKNDEKKANWTAVIILVITAAFAAFIIYKAIRFLPDISLTYNALLLAIISTTVAIVSFVVFIICKKNEAISKEEKLLADNQKIKEEIRLVKEGKYKMPYTKGVHKESDFSKGFDYIELSDENEEDKNSEE
ncbi:MAG: hypothetical protein K5917_00535 [Clostridiales bacterium]|nr:hypothetical protein [Clostridiales bacterium]